LSVSVLILYDAKGRSIESMARAVADGVEKSGRAIPILKTIEEASREDLLSADGLILGSPNWSGITGTFKQWLDDQGDLWEELALAGRPGAAFTTGTGRHSGLETTLRQLIHWMLACGMLIIGLPWSERMRTSGSYYGATAAGGVTGDDLSQAQELGARVAGFAARLKAP
jgi:NAD(P)H dehydrogenase (quinone)